MNGTVSSALHQPMPPTEEEGEPTCIIEMQGSGNLNHLVKMNHERFYKMRHSLQVKNLSSIKKLKVFTKQFYSLFYYLFFLFFPLFLIFVIVMTVTGIFRENKAYTALYISLIIADVISFALPIIFYPRYRERMASLNQQIASLNQQIASSNQKYDQMVAFFQR